MKDKIVQILIYILTSSNCFSQDTIKIEPSIFYSQEEEKQLSGKGFHGNYSKEIIVFSDNAKRVECCYYVDTLVRNCIGTNYKIIGDSVLQVQELDLESWNYKKLNNGSYFFERTHNGLYEFWESIGLIPFEPITPIITTTSDKLDTLWTTSFNSNCNQYPNYRATEFHKNKIIGKVYEYDKIDLPPTQLNGKALNKVNIKRIVSCPSEPAFMDITLVAMIITNKGEIKNIEQALGTLNEGCPFTMQEIIKEIKSWGKINPAIRNGRKVNVRWFIEINNEARKYIHPAIKDSKLNRKNYIKRKKTVDNKG